MPKRLATLLATLFFTVAATRATAQAQRSVVIILMDSLRPDHLQTYGYGRETSPNILAFSRRATVFEQAYPAGSWTRPSILALLTGRYSSELTTNLGGGSPLKDGHPTLATVLRSWKYTTAAFYNTAQLAPAAANVQAGFDTYVDYGSKKYVEANVGQGVDKTIEFLGAARKPAFVFLHILDPHHPYIPTRDYFGKVPTKKYLDSYSFATGIPTYHPDKVDPCYLVKDMSTVPEMAELYDSEIRELDTEVGRLLRYLDGDKRYRDALVIITSDHGEEFGEHGGLFHGARFYEESLRVPLIIRDPKYPFSIGRRVPGVVSLVDVVPTILSLTGITYPESAYSGKSMLLYFTRRIGPPRDTAIIEKPGCGFDATAAIRKGPWKMIIRITRPKIELYDLQTDPGEKHDLSASKAANVRRAYADLYGTFETWYRTVNRPLATRNGDVTPPLPPELRERLKALGYLQ
jgi:arylsulfatase A-like enzyme